MSHCAPEVDDSKVDGSRVDGSKVDGSKVDGSKVDGSKVDGSGHVVSLREGDLVPEHDLSGGGRVSGNLSRQTTFNGGRV